MTVCRCAGVTSLRLAPRMRARRRRGGFRNGSRIPVSPHAIAFFVVVGIFRDGFDTMLLTIATVLIRMFALVCKALGLFGFGVFRTMTTRGSSIGSAIGRQLFRRHSSHTGIMTRFGIGFVAHWVAFVVECLDLCRYWLGGSVVSLRGLALDSPRACGYVVDPLDTSH